MVLRNTHKAFTNPQRLCYNNNEGGGLPWSSPFQSWQTHVFDEAHVVAALRAEPDGYIEMTHSGNEVRGAVEAVADGRRYFCPRATRLLQTLQAQSRQAGPEPTLTPREEEILCLVAVGKSNKEVAARLRVSVSTVRVHRANLMRKLRLHSAVDLTRHAMRHGLVPTR